MLWRNAIRRSLGPLLWLGSLGLVIYYAPFRYWSLQLDPGEQAVAIRGATRELVTVAGGPKLNSAAFWKAQILKRQGITPPTPQWTYLSQGDSIFVRDLDTGNKRQLTRLGKAIYSVQPCAKGDRLCVEYGNQQELPTQFKLSILDTSSGKSIWMTDWLRPDNMPRWSVSRDGRVAT
jgi:hypothetical protein